MMRLPILIFLIFMVSPVLSAEIFDVKAEFMELHTGAGRGYPVVNVLEKGEVFTLLKKKYDWIKVQTSRGELGWISYKAFVEASQLKRTNNRNKVALSRWQFGAGAGLLGFDPIYSAQVHYYFAPQLAIGGEVGQVAGAHSSSNFYTLQARLSLWRKVLFSPFAALGTGQWMYSPKNNLINANSHTYSYFKLLGGIMYVPYKQLALEASLNSVFLKNQDINFGGGIAISVFYD